MCEYSKEGWPAAVRLEMLRDRFVFGLLDDTVKERLLREKDLDLAKAVEITQRQELLKQQIKEMASKQTQNVHAIGHKKTKPSDTFKCGCCGKWHRSKEYPAYGKMCDLCHKPNHFTKVCRTRQHQKQTQTGHHKHKNKKKVDTIEESESESETSDEGSTLLFIDPLRIEA